MRPGAALYGINPTPEADNPMQPVVELKARIVQIRNVERGESVGYGGTWTARRPTRLAIVSAGYADGYFRAASTNDGTRGAEVVVAGKRCPVAGRISMDLMAIDVTDLDNNAARRGHMVTLIGEGITVDELAHHFGTIGYEVLTSLGRALCADLQGRRGRGCARSRDSRIGIKLFLTRFLHANRTHFARKRYVTAFWNRWPSCRPRSTGRGARSGKPRHGRRRGGAGAIFLVVLAACAACSGVGVCAWAVAGKSNGAMPEWRACSLDI